MLKIDHRPKKELVYQVLKDAIIDRKWNPGEKKSFFELSSALNVSRTPVAEACQLLETEGLVVIRPQVGVEAAYLSREEITENYKVRSVLEGLAGSEAVQNLKREDVARLEDLLREMEGAEKKDDFAKFYDTNRVFHRLIYEASRMGQLIKTLDHFWETGRRYRFFYRHMPKVLEDSNFYHRKVLAGIQSNDPADVRAALEKDSWVFGEKLAKYIDSNVPHTSAKSIFLDPDQKHQKSLKGGVKERRGRSKIVTPGLKT